MTHNTLNFCVSAFPLYRSPDSGNIKLKMVYASSKDAIKKPFTGLAAAFEAHDRADLDYDAFAAELGKK